MIFHLAIPTRYIPEAIEFYEKLGAKLGRSTETWAILNLNGIQLVCHKARPGDIQEIPTIYPRHFGFIIEKYAHFNEAYRAAEKNKLNFFETKFTRFPGQISEHETFFLCDPSNNMIEFKWYKNQGSIFGKDHSA